MNTAFRSVVLFTPPRLAEERKTYWPGLSQYSQPAVATGSFGDVDLNETFKVIHANVMDGWDTLTGAKDQRIAQANALSLQQLRAEQTIYEARSRQEGWSIAAPWLAVGGAVAIVAIAMAARK